MCDRSNAPPAMSSRCVPAVSSRRARIQSTTVMATSATMTMTVSMNNVGRLRLVRTRSNTCNMYRTGPSSMTLMNRLKPAAINRVLRIERITEAIGVGAFRSDKDSDMVTKIKKPKRRPGSGHAVWADRGSSENDQEMMKSPDVSEAPFVRVAMCSFSMLPLPSLS